MDQQPPFKLTSLPEHIARRGKLTTKQTTFSTPCCFLNTIRGHPQNLTSDLLATLKVKGLTLNLGDLADQGPIVKTYGLGLHKFLGLEKPLALFLLSRDPSTWDDAVTGSGVFCFTSAAGRRQLSPEAWASLESQLSPDFFSSLSLSASYQASFKKAKKSVDLTLSWLDKTLKENPSAERNIFGCIEGGRFINERVRSAQETSKRNVVGFLLDGFGLDESPIQRKEVLNAVIKELPPSKPRVIVGLGIPEDILEAIDQGVDIFTTNYPNMITDLGLALTFNLDPTDESKPSRPRLQVLLLCQPHESLYSPFDEYA